MDGIEHVRTVRQTPVLNVRHHDPPGPEIALLVKLTAVHLFAAVLGDVRRKPVRALDSEAEQVWVADVDLTHLLAVRPEAKDALPDRTQQRIHLTTPDSNMKMQRTPLLLLDHGDIVKLLMLAHLAAKGLPVLEGGFAVDHIFTVRKCHHAISRDSLAAFRHFLLCTTTGDFFAGLPILRLTALSLKAGLCRAYKEAILRDGHNTLAVVKNALTGRIRVLPRSLDAVVGPVIWTLRIWITRNRSEFNFIDLLKEKMSLKNDAAVAQYLGWGSGKISQYRTGTRVMDDEACLAVAMALNIDPIQVVGAACIDRAEKEGKPTLWSVSPLPTLANAATRS